MAMNERDQWVIPAGDGITDYSGTPRLTAVRIANNEVILYASATDDENLADVPTCLRMPNWLADQLGLYLQCAAEANRLQQCGEE